MKKVLIMSFLFSCLLLAQAQELNYVPGEIIIKYEKSGEKPVGSKIIVEHSQVAKLINSSFPEIKSENFVHVFGNVINEMVKKNISEKELFETKSLRTGLKKISQQNEFIEFSTIMLFRTKKIDEDIEKLSEKINNNPDLYSDSGYRIVFAEPNYLKKADVEETDPLYSEQWSHKITSIEQAWAITSGNPQIKLAIIDSGVDITHPDLSANILNDGYDFVDIDTSLYINSNYFTLPGEDYTTPDDNISDYNGHGTHCAGIVAAIGDNGIGVKGVSPGCKILPIRAAFGMKYLGNESAFLETSTIVEAINYAVDNGANIISMSFGGNHSQLEEEAIKYAYNKNVVLIAASGNNNSMNKSYPAAYDEVLAVTSIDTVKYKSSFSNFGYWTDIAAPGDKIISTVPTSGGANTDASGYKKLSGTSMAAPYIAGVAALILSKNPEMNNDLVYQTLLTSVDSYMKTTNDIINNTDKYIGTGIVNVYKALSDEEACTAKIISPSILDNLFIREDLNISGKAYGKNFSKYIFEYRNYTDEYSSWKTIGSYYNTSVDSGYLATVSIPEEGIFYIRLKVVNTSNKEFTDVIGPVTVDKRLKENWPIATEHESISSPIISDIDNDGVVETIFTNSEGKIFVVDPSGKSKSGWPILLTNQYNVQGVVGYSNPAVEDIDNDGKKEIVVRDGQLLYVYDCKGFIKSGWPQEMGWIFYGNALVGSPVITDINNDGEKEIVVTHRGIEGTDGKILIFDNSGNELPGWPVFLPSRYILTTSPVVCDLDGDNHVEIIIQCLNESTRQGYLYLFDETGNILSGWPKEFGTGSSNSPIAVDINNDGLYEIVACSHIGSDNTPSKIGVYVFNKEGTCLSGWPSYLNYAQYGYYDVEAGISAGDINNDGYKEILVASCGYSYSLWALNKGGQILWSVLSKDLEYVSNSCPVIADINEDSKPEIIITKLNNLAIYGKVLVFDNNGNELSDLSRIIPDKIRATPSIGDVDGDNKLELICTSQNGNAYCWDYDATYSQSKLIWPTYQQNYLRTGVFIIQQTPPSITELVEPANNMTTQQTDIKFIWNPTEGALKYHFQLANDTLFTNTVNEDTSVTEITYQVNSLEKNREYFWRVRAKNKYGNGEWSDVGIFTIMIALPEKPQLVFPTTDQSNQSTKVTFRWNKVENAEIYFIQLSQVQTFTSIAQIDSTADTTTTISNLIEGQRYYWRTQAKNITGFGPWSDGYKFTTSITAPASLVLERTGLNEITLTWEDNSPSEDGFIIEKKQNLQTTFSFLDSLKTSGNKYVDNNNEQGLTYSYRIKAYTKYAESNYSNEASIVVVSSETENIPKEYALEQNYPNPFNPSTTIQFSLPKESYISLKVYNINGQEVTTLLSKHMNPGIYKVEWNGYKYSSGVYYYRIIAGNFIDTKKFVFIK
jgi:subtilisin family serine protease